MARATATQAASTWQSLPVCMRSAPAVGRAFSIRVLRLVAGKWRGGRVRNCRVPLI